MAKNQIENIPLKTVECDRMLTQRYSNIDIQHVRESPSDLLIGVSPDTKNNQQGYYTPDNLVSQSPDNEIINTNGFQNNPFPLQDGANTNSTNQGNTLIVPKKEKKYNKFILLIDCLTCLISLIIVFISYSEYRIYSVAEIENEIIVKKPFQHNDQTKNLRNVIIAFSALLTLLIIANFFLMKKINDQTLLMNHTIETFSKYEKKATFILLFEILFNMMILPYQYDVLIEGRSLGGTYTYSLDTVFTAINILKSYHVFKLAFHYASSFEFFNFHISFLFKAAFHKRPFLYTTILFSFTCLVSTLLLQIVEMQNKI